MLVYMCSPGICRDGGLSDGYLALKSWDMGQNQKWTKVQAKLWLHGFLLFVVNMVIQCQTPKWLRYFRVVWCKTVPSRICLQWWLPGPRGENDVCCANVDQLFPNLLLNLVVPPYS